ncbi:hypothetical protein ACTFIU_007464 [Dictyostelium citrinum]
MLLKKSLLLISLIFAIAAVSSATKYTSFTISGTGCDANRIITENNGACQTICTGLYGKIVPTNDTSKFDLTAFADQGCTKIIKQNEVTCLPNNQKFQLLGYDIICISESSSASTLIGSIGLIFLGILLSLI